MLNRLWASFFFLIVVTEAKERLEDGHHHHLPEDHFQRDHEAVLGSRSDVNKFNDLSPEESKIRLRQLATEKIDSDQDGIVTRSELTKWIRKSLKRINQEESDEAFPEVDLDKDGSISWSEYFEDTFGTDIDEESLLNEDNKEELRMLVEDKAVFQAADLDADGRLTREEYLLFMHPEESEQTLNALVSVAIKERDRNGDGVISLDEFLGDSPEGTEKADWVADEKDKFANEYDKNKDGVLDAGEVVNWLLDNPEATAVEEAEHLIQESDSDKDGDLSIDEIVNAHSHWVGSEATNHGDHIRHLNEIKDEL